MNVIKNKVLVIGCDNGDDIGDIAHRVVMGQFFPNDNLVFYTFDKLSNVKLSNYDAVIVTGTDVINDYINDKISTCLRNFKGPKIAFNIGISSPNFISEKYLGHFDHVFTHSYEDIRQIQCILGSQRSHFIPDITLTYPHTYSLTTESAIKKCGVFLMGNIMTYPDIVGNIAHIISKLALTHNVELYCFHSREDIAISNEVKELALKRIQECSTDDNKLLLLLKSARSNNRIIVNPKQYNPQEMLNIISGLDFAVCMRYYSHIFCTIVGIPFMSISIDRKTSSFMKQAELSDYQYEIKYDECRIPISNDYEQMRDVGQRAIRDKIFISNQLKTFLKQSKNLLTSRQASRLLTINKTDIRTGIADFIDETGDYENGARLLSSYIIGYPDSPYISIMSNKFKESEESLPDAIYDNVQYLTHHGASLKNEFKELVSNDKPLPLYIDLREYQSCKNIQVEYGSDDEDNTDQQLNIKGICGDWYLTCENLYKLNSKNQRGDHNGIICDMYIDRTFDWAQSYMMYRGIIPYTSPWCGFIHHTPNNIQSLLVIPEFIQSLYTCIALFTLSEPSSKYLRCQLATIAPHIDIITFARPVITPMQSFTFRGYTRNTDRKLININTWMHNPLTIYRLETLSIQRAVLTRQNINDHLPPDDFNIAYNTGNEKESSTIPQWVSGLIKWLISINISISYYHDSTLYINNATQVNELNSKIRGMITSITRINCQTDKDYDSILSQNIVFLDMIDAAAIHTVIECIVRRTPIIINKIAATVALLGDDYPLYYKNIEDIDSLLTGSHIDQAHQYLKKLDSKRYTMNYFLDSMYDVTTNLI